MVSSDAQNDAQSDAQSPAEKAHEYQQSVLHYEALDKQIDDLLQSRGGVSENLSDEDFAHYRELADLRDLAYNRMKTLERALLDE
jgi:hypothetical protein